MATGSWYALEERQLSFPNVSVTMGSGGEDGILSLDRSLISPGSIAGNVEIIVRSFGMCPDLSETDEFHVSSHRL